MNTNASTRRVYRRYNNIMCIMLSAILWDMKSYIKIMSIMKEQDTRPPIMANQKNYLLMPRCHPPHQSASSAWRYYATLVDTNLDTAAKARYLTDNATTTTVGYSKYIPHRLIFTHKENLFKCSISASNNTISPDLYTLAENAKATVNAYRRIWSDLEVVFLTDQDCVSALNEVEPDLVPFFHKEIGMYKSDICRAAYLYLYGGYYFDVDLLVVRPFFAGSAKFVTVKAWNPDAAKRNDGFFQAFLASEKHNSIVGRSVQIMLEALQGKRPRGTHLGPTALEEAWIEEGKDKNRSTVENNDRTTIDNGGAYFLIEGSENALKRDGYTKISNVLRRNRNSLSQKVPTLGNGTDCKFVNGVCNFFVIDGSDETLYFYSRILGTRWCGRLESFQCTYIKQ